MKVGYFINRYPAVSHTFVRREIRAVEESGITVLRYALRPGESLVDPEDWSEQKNTQYILLISPLAFVRCCVAMAAAKPLQFGRSLLLAARIGWRSDRGFLRHFAYLAEAAVLAFWCRRDGVEHIHAHFGTNSAAVAMLASQISGIPYSFTAHGPDEFEKAELLSVSTKLEHAKFAVCVSHYGRSQLMRWSRPALWPKIAVVHCGLDRSFFAFQAPPLPSAQRLVCIGRLSEQKAQIVLVGALRRLRDAGVRCEMVLAGDGPMRREVEDAIARAGLQREVTITGWISGDRVRAELAAARALVLPSFAENLPVVIMEALALSRPAISTYVAGIPELIRPGKSGWLVPAGDEIALADAIREVLQAPVEQLAAMGAAGRAQVLEQHDVQKEATKLKALFEGHLPAAI